MRIFCLKRLKKIEKKRKMLQKSQFVDVIELNRIEKSYKLKNQKEKEKVFVMTRKIKDDHCYLKRFEKSFLFFSFFDGLNVCLKGYLVNESQVFLFLSLSLIVNFFCCS